MSNRIQFDRRASGLLLHITSLPGPDGSGDLGSNAYRFADFLATAGQCWWQMLPVVPPGVAPGFSPYSAFSAFAGSPWVVSLEQLSAEGLLPKNRASFASTSTADFARVIPHRERSLRAAFDAFNGSSRRRSALADYANEQKSWLDDWALFAALKKSFEDSEWFTWEPGIRLRKPDALSAAKAELADEIRFHCFVQFQFDRQWRALQAHCRKLGVGLLGDLPIFVAADSCDVWAHRELFALNADGRPAKISGCPPDYFSKKGQLWGHPQYRWESHKKTGFNWWVSRFANELDRFDGVRVDHFIGFHRTWAIPGKAKDGRRGTWLLSPGRELFAAVKKRVGPAAIIAEDLGVLTPEAEALRDELDLPGMRVTQFGFNGDTYHLPHRFVKHCVAYTGTHDNNTVRGWFAGINGEERAKALAYLNTTPSSVHDDMIRALLESVARTVIFPVQDVLGLGPADRMNLPGTDNKNWRWRLKPGQLTTVLAKELRALTELYERD